MTPGEKLTVSGLVAALLLNLGMLVGVVTHGVPYLAALNTQGGPGSRIDP